MKFSMAVVATALATFAVAQDLSGIPTCALKCIEDATTAVTKCQAKEYACQCIPANNKLITAEATPCVFDACSSEDAVKTLSGTAALCDSLPAEPASSAAAPASSAAAPASSAAAPASSAAAPASSAEAPASSAEAPASSAVAPASSAAAEPTAAPSSVVGAPGTVYVTVCDSSSTKVAVPTVGSNGTAAPTPTGSKTPEFTAAAGKLGAGLASVAAFALAALAL